MAISNNITHGKDVNIYHVDIKKTVITLNKQDVNVLHEYAPLLIQLLNYKWVQLLEGFNRVPKLAQKIRGSANQDIKRKSLAKYKEILLKQFKDKPIIDFYTGQVLKENEISIDHVIPWSFMYSDDLWNLVITSKSHNSKKSNLVVEEKYIKKLIDDKRELLIILSKGNDTNINDLQTAVDSDYISKFYRDLRT